MRKRIFKITLIVVSLVLLAAGVILITSGDPVLIVTAPREISTGGAFNVDISIKHNPGIAVFVIDLKYDETIFEFVSVENGNLFTSELAIRDRDFDDYYATRAMFAELDPFRGDGVLYKVYFNVRHDTSPGEYDFELLYSPGNIVETPGKEVNPDTINTKVTVS